MSRAAVCLVVLLLVRWSLPAAAASQSQTYAAIRAQLRTSAVPVLLPVPLPRALGAARSVAVVTAGRTGYYVGFSPLPHCAGAISCAFFHVAGFPRTLAGRLFRRDRSLRLPDGTRGYFRPQDCSGASCTEASLTFERRGAVYELDVKVAKDTLGVIENAYRNLLLLR